MFYTFETFDPHKFKGKRSDYEDAKKKIIELKSLYAQISTRIIRHLTRQREIIRPKQEDASQKDASKEDASQEEAQTVLIVPLYDVLALDELEDDAPNAWLKPIFSDLIEVLDEMALKQLYLSLPGLVPQYNIEKWKVFNFIEMRRLVFYFRSQLDYGLDFSELFDNDLS